jgi:hypothetical protein
MPGTGAARDGVPGMAAAAASAQHARLAEMILRAAILKRIMRVARPYLVRTVILTPILRYPGSMNMPSTKAFS